MGSLSQIGGGALITGTAIAALLGYEEALGLKVQGGPLYEREKESKEQFRRSFIKSCAAVVGTIGSLIVGNKINSRLNSGKERLEETVTETKRIEQISSTNAFSGYFASTPNQLLSEVMEHKTEIDYSLKRGVKSNRVRTAMQNFAPLIVQLDKEHKDIFNDSVPRDLGELCKSAIITKAVNEARGGERSLGEVAVLLENLAVGAAMVATIIPLELVNHKLGNE